MQGGNSMPLYLGLTNYAAQRAQGEVGGVIAPHEVGLR